MDLRTNAVNPNFGMALRIKMPEEKLAELPMTKLKELAQAGERLKGHKFVDVDYYDPYIIDVKPRGCANKYRAPFKAKQDLFKEFIRVETTWQGPGDNFNKTYHAVYNLGDAVTAAKTVEKINKGSTLDSAVEFAEAIEKRCAMQEAETAKKTALKKEQEEMANELLKKYSLYKEI